MPIVVPQGNFSLSLKPNIKIGQGATNAWLLNPSADPTTTPLNAPAGSIAFYGGVNYIKQDSGSSTNWSAVATTAANTSTSSVSIYNLGLACSVSSNALTIAVKQANGSSDPTAGAGAVKIGFRSATASSGAYSELSVTSALSVTVPSGATLGHVNATNLYVWVYALNNGGTIELAVSGVEVFKDQSIVSTTALGTGSDSGNVIYSASARSNVPIRLIGRLLVNQTTAGTWASAPTDVVTCPTPVFNCSELLTLPTSGSWVTNTTYSFYYRRVGKIMEAEVQVMTSGAPTATALTVNIPSPYLIDTTNLVDSGGFTSYLGFGSCNDSNSTIATVQIRYNSTSTVGVMRCDASGTYLTTNSGVSNTQPFTFGNGDTVVFRFSVPIVGWSSYGPDN